VAEVGQGRVDDVEAVANPFGLAVPDEDDLHPGDGTVTPVSAVVEDSDTGSEQQPTRPWVRVLLTLVVAGFAVFWVWALFFASKEAVNRIDDTAWAERAEALCVEATQARLELTDLTRIDQPTPELIGRRADIIDRSTDILEAMLDDIVDVEPVDEKGQAIVPMWEAEYRTYLDDRRAYADQLRASGENLAFYETDADGIPISERISTFAGDNDMASCSPPIDLSR
jgi:hypothetical protein